MASKPFKGESTTPDALTETFGGSVERSHDIAQKLGSIMQSITYLEAFASDTKSELKAISKDITEAKAQVAALVPVATWIARGVWTSVTGIFGFGLVILGMWVKKHFNL